MTKQTILICCCALLLLPPLDTVAHSPPSNARVFFVEPADGNTLNSPIRIKAGIEGFGITPAGTRDQSRHTGGHHHVLVDVERLPNFKEGWTIPHDTNHIHLDGGETEIMLELPPGEHTLQLLLGDEDHEPFKPSLISEEIVITVQ